MAMRPALILLVVVAVTAAILLVAPRRAAAISWEGVKARIHHRFPEVASISTEGLAARLADTSRPPPLLLDARAPEEYAVSHLRGALLASNLAAARAALAGRSKGAEVVVYCSVGYRSAELAEALQEAGYKGVRNLEGSISQWANEGRPVYREGGRGDGCDDQAVRAVHPYNHRWGRLLKHDLWSWHGGE